MVCWQTKRLLHHWLCLDNVWRQLYCFVTKHLFHFSFIVSLAVILAIFIIFRPLWKTPLMMMMLLLMMMMMVMVVIRVQMRMSVTSSLQENHSCTKTDKRWNKKAVSRSSPVCWAILFPSVVRKSTADSLAGPRDSTAIGWKWYYYYYYYYHIHTSMCRHYSANSAAISCEQIYNILYSPSQKTLWFHTA